MRPLSSRTAAGLVAIALSACGTGGPEAAGPRMAVEVSGPELVVYVEDPGAAVAPGRDQVELVCVARGGAEILRRSQPWPFTDTDGGTLAPHVHTPFGPIRPDEIARCELEGTGLSGVPSLGR